MKTPEQIEYRADIDGLRALAIIPVLMFHAGLGFPGGFVGVDIFFVISGFLITSLILRDLRSNNFDVIKFFERRIRRLLPALVVVMAFTLIAAWFFFLPDDFREVSKSLIAQIFIVSNIFFWQETGYFSAEIETKPLLHTWSLAVEEQFYLIFPFILVVCSRLNNLRIKSIILGFGLISLGLSIMGSFTHPSASFYLLPTRAWEMMVGAYLAAMPRNGSFKPHLNEILSLLGLGLIIFAIFAYSSTTRFPGFAAIPPCLGAALIIYSGTRQSTFVSRILSIKPLVFIGLISYSLYLWHWPIFVFSRYSQISEQNSVLKVILLIVSIILAVASWKYIETPFRVKLVFATQTKIFKFAFITLILLLGAGSWINYNKGFPTRLPESAQLAAASQTNNAFRNEISVDQAKAGEFMAFGSVAKGKDISVLIWGDSHAMAITSALDDVCQRIEITGAQATHSATAPLLDYSGDDPYGLEDETPIFSKAVVDYVDRRNIKIVFIAALWRSYGPPEQLFQKLSKTVTALSELGVKTYIIKDVPEPGFDVPRQAALAIFHNQKLSTLELEKETYLAKNSQFELIFQEIEKIGAKTLDTQKYFLNKDNRYDVIRADKTLYFDSHHLSIDGARLLIPMFEEILRSELKK